MGMIFNYNCFNCQAAQISYDIDHKQFCNGCEPSTSMPSIYGPLASIPFLEDTIYNGTFRDYMNTSALDPYRASMSNRQPIAMYHCSECEVNMPFYGSEIDSKCGECQGYHRDENDDLCNCNEEHFICGCGDSYCGRRSEDEQCTS